MLNRSTLRTSAPALRVNWGTALRGLLSGPDAWLMQLTLIAVVVSLLACVYLWQSSAIRDLQRDTVRMQQKSEALERENVALMLQVARGNNPAYIAENARLAGAQPSQPALVMQVPNHDQATPKTGPGFVGRWQPLLDRIPRPNAVIQVAAWMR